MAKTQYEGMFLFPGGVEVDASLTRVRGMIEKHGGSIIVIKKWDERKLTYEIKKQKRGLYVLAYFTSPGTAIAAVTRDVNLSDDVLRVLITDASHLTTDEMEKVEPQPIVVKEPTFGEGGPGRSFGGDRPSFDNDRGDRGGRGGDRGPRYREDEPANA